jgi:hypothetical protein
MDVVNAEQVSRARATINRFCLLVDNNDCSPKARIAEEAGACAVMALERVPADIRAEGKHTFNQCFLSYSAASRWCSHGRLKYSMPERYN